MAHRTATKRDIVGMRDVMIPHNVGISAEYVDEEARTKVESLIAVLLQQL